MPKAIQDEVQQFSRTLVDKADLAPDGRETQSHITVLYGLHEANPAAVAKALAGEGPIRVKLGKISKFPDSGDGEVLKIDIDSPDLRRLNKKISGLPHTSTHPGYRPHLTLAYVRPGTADKYIGKKNPLEGREIILKEIAVSDRGGEQHMIPLVGKQTTPPPGRQATPPGGEDEKEPKFTIGSAQARLTKTPIEPMDRWKLAGLFQERPLAGRRILMSNNQMANPRQSAGEAVLRHEVLHDIESQGPRDDRSGLPLGVYDGKVKELQAIMAKHGLEPYEISTYLLPDPVKGKWKDLEQDIAPYRDMVRERYIRWALGTQGGNKDVGPQLGLILRHLPEMRPVFRKVLREGLTAE